MSLNRPTSYREISQLPLILALIWLTLFPAYSMADDFAPSRFSFNGFATLGAVRGGSEALGYRQDIAEDGVFEGDWSLKTDSLLALQFGVRITDDFDAAMQLVYEDRAINGIEESLKWAYLRYRLSPNVTARAGRIGLDLFMLSEYRHLGFSYLWARPPVEFYGAIPLEYFDGVDVGYTTSLGVGMLSTKFFAGTSSSAVDAVDSGDKLRVDKAIGATVSWETMHWQLRFSATTVEFNDDLQETFRTDDFIMGLLSAATLIKTQTPFDWTDAEHIADQISLQDVTANYYAVGISYDHAAWVIQSEINYYDAEDELFKSYTGQYLSVGYRIASTTLYGLVGRGKQLKSREKVTAIPTIPPIIPGSAQIEQALGQLRAGVQALYDLNYIDQHSLSIGFRWDVRYDVALKFQWDRTWVDDAGGLLWVQTTLTEKETIDTYSLNLNVIF